MKSLTLSTMQDDNNDSEHTTTNTLLDGDRSPLLETSTNSDDFLSANSSALVQNGQGRSSFDNLGLVEDTDSQERTDVEDEEDRRSSSVRDSIASSEGGGVGGISDSKASISDDQGSGDDVGLGGRRKPKLRIVS